MGFKTCFDYHITSKHSLISTKYKKADIIYIFYLSTTNMNEKNLYHNRFLYPKFESNPKKESYQKYKRRKML